MSAMVPPHYNRDLPVTLIAEFSLYFYSQHKSLNKYSLHPPTFHTPAITPTDRTWQNRGKRIVVNLQTRTKFLVLQSTNKIIKLIYLDKDGVNRCLGQASFTIVTISGADQNAHNCIGALYSLTRCSAGYCTSIPNIHCLVRGNAFHWRWIPKFPRYPASHLILRDQYS